MDLEGIMLSEIIQNTVWSHLYAKLKKQNETAHRSRGQIGGCQRHGHEGESGQKIQPQRWVTPVYNDIERYSRPWVVKPVAEKCICYNLTSMDEREK